MAPHLRVQLLGDVALAIDDTEVDIGGDQPRALLAELALAPGAVRTPGALAEAVWGTDPPANAGRRLQTLVSRMRGALAPHLAGTDPAEVLAGAGRGYALNVDPDAVDAARFERLVEQGEADLAAGDPRKALHHLAEALDAWQGPPFGLIDTPGLQVPADRLVRLRSRASEAQARALIQVGSLDDAAEVAAELVRKEPFRESAVALLMQALYHADRQADALAAYRGLRTRLADELGVDPSLTLQAMERAILVHDPAQLDEIAARAGGTFTQWWQRLPARLRSASATPIVGRSEELRAIVIAGRAVSDGTHRMVLVDGHAGIGKTRLVAEAARTLVTQGFEVLYGRCDEDVRVPYQPVMECLRAFMTTRRPVDPGSLGPNAHELVALVPEIRQIVTTAGDLGDLDPLSARHRLFDAVAAWLATGSRAQPVAVVLDDLHWASPDTILLLRHLVRSEGLGRVLFVAVHRPPDDDSPLARLLGDLRRDQEITRVSLDGLTAPEIGMMAESRGATLSPAAATTVTDATAGNPWFVEQLLHDADEGATLGDGGSLVRLGATTTGIRELVSARAGRLGAEAQRFLRVAAVAGPSFDSRAVADAAELSSDDHGRAEQALIRAGFLELEPEGRRLGFVHALARGALLARSRTANAGAST
ncbi:MAG: BTAD domain-containing putative transcriptional regulator [Nitriliruptorales bacterium]|nr:BTAD domain-containing putative transcriptional regulator [Nitriliruptorales bacterium]